VKASCQSIFASRQKFYPSNLNKFGAAESRFKTANLEQVLRFQQALWPIVVCHKDIKQVTLLQ
jgi:hypothetical protein